MFLCECQKESKGKIPLCTLNLYVAKETSIRTHDVKFIFSVKTEYVKSENNFQFK